MNQQLIDNILQQLSDNENTTIEEFVDKLTKKAIHDRCKAFINEKKLKAMKRVRNLTDEEINDS